MILSGYVREHSSSWWGDVGAERQPALPPT